MRKPMVCQKGRARGLFASLCPPPPPFLLSLIPSRVSLCLGHPPALSRSPSSALGLEERLRF